MKSKIKVIDFAFELGLINDFLFSFFFFGLNPFEILFTNFLLKGDVSDEKCLKTL